MFKGQIIEALTLHSLMQIIRVMGKGVLPASFKCQRVDGWWIATILEVNAASPVAA